MKAEGQQESKNILDRIANWIVPSQVQIDKHTEDYRKARLISFSLLIVSLIPIFYTPVYLFISYYWGIYVQTVVAFCCIIVILYYRKTGNSLLVGNLFAVVAFTSVLCLALTNQSYSGILWLTVAPISAFLHADYKSGVIWSFIVFISISSYYIGLFQGYDYLFLFNPEYRLLGEFINAIGLFTCIIAIIMVYETEKDALISRVKKSNQEINEQNAQIKQNQEEILAMNSDLATKNIELKSISEELRDKNTKMTDSLRYAQTIQAALLPHHESLASTFSDFFVLYRPKDIVSGDFYWLEEIEERKGLSILAVGDCTGHGVSGAFMSIVASSILNEIVLKKHILEPHLILEAAHRLFGKALQQETSNNKDGIDLAICSIQAWDNYYKICFSGAKSPILLIQPSKSEIEVIKGTNRSIGGYQSKKNRKFEAREFILEKDTTIYMLSDGFADQNGPRNKKIG